MTQTALSQLLPLIGALLAGGVGVSIVVELLKKFVGLNSAKVIHFLVASLAFATAGLQYVLSLHNLPPQVLGVSTFAIYGASQWAYIFVGKASSFLSRVDVSIEHPAPAVAPPIVANSPEPVVTPAITAPTPQVADF